MTRSAVGPFRSLYTFTQCVACAGAGIRATGEASRTRRRATPDRRGTSNLATAAGLHGTSRAEQRAGGDEQITRPDWMAHFEDETSDGRQDPGFAFAFACVAEAGLAQTQPANATPPAGGKGASAAAMAQEASNPFAASWLMQIQQNNNWVEMPFGEERRVQSNLQFQPLLSVRLTETSMLIVRPVLTMVNSLPTLDQNGRGDRTTGFGDTVLGFAIPRPFFGGKLMVGAGPTFIFPTASERQARPGRVAGRAGPRSRAAAQERDRLRLRAAVVQGRRATAGTPTR